MGHETRLCAGEVPRGREDERVIPAMHFTDPAAAAVDRRGLRPGLRSRRRAARGSPPRRCAAPAAGRLGRGGGNRGHGGRERLGDPDAPAARPLRWLASSAKLGFRPSATTTTTPGSASGSRAASSRTCSRRRFPPDLPSVRHVSINSLAAAELQRAARPRLGRDPERVRVRGAAAGPRRLLALAAQRARDGDPQPARRAADARRPAQGHRARDRARPSPRGSAGAPAHHQPGRRRGPGLPLPAARPGGSARCRPPVRSRSLCRTSAGITAIGASSPSPTPTWRPISSPSRACTRASATPWSSRSTSASRWSSTGTPCTTPTSGRSASASWRSTARSRTRPCARSGTSSTTSSVARTTRRTTSPSAQRAPWVHDAARAARRRARFPAGRGRA